MPATPRPLPRRLGIIDVGTNSAHLVIGRLRPDGTFRVLRRERALTRLGDGGLVTGRLTAPAQRRVMAVLARHAALLRRFRVEEVDAVATSAVREAANGRAFVRRVRARLRLPLRILSGREEARLIGLGVAQARRARQAALILAIGGGSAQVIQGRGRRPGYVASVPLGCARLSQRFIRHDPPGPEEVRALARHVRRVWAPAARAVRRRRWHRALGSSAMIHQVMRAAASLRRHRAGNAGRDLTVTQPALRRLVERLAASTASERRRLAGLDPRRQDLALPTAVTLLAWMDACGIRTLHGARGSLREGVAAQRCARVWGRR